MFEEREVCLPWWSRSELSSAAQVIKLKVPPVPHVATNVAVSAYPVLQVTVVVEPVVPDMEPLSALSEFGT